MIRFVVYNLGTLVLPFLPSCHSWDVFIIVGLGFVNYGRLIYSYLMIHM
jgi:hypothetical protein